MKYIRDSVVYEQISFVPAVTINCYPPYEEGKPDSMWVSYRKGNRPKSKSQWENLLRMKIQKIIK